MEIISISKALSKTNRKKVIKSIIEGKIFVYPTDTIYGIGCDALNEDSVNKIREIKDRFDKPFSVIAPNKPWIYNNFKVNKRYIERLPGPFTFILKVIKKNLVAKSVNFNLDTLGVRIPDNEFTKLVQEAGIPFITTSVNIKNKKPITSIDKIPRKIAKEIDIVIDAGELKNNPSTIIDLTGKIAKILR
ncbi:MAG: L-threonylcarbamoyladenylate synthase [Candidatus Nanoarchaeia archaeon]|nr:L-threonylcarbamoyladenylate synthase [Candidatus Nanoarchaeia archaeon]